MKKNFCSSVIGAAAIFFASLAGVGFIKPASATWGSAAASMGLFFFYPDLPPYSKILLICVTFIFGACLAEFIQKEHSLKDPHFIVIDECVGIMITAFLLGPVALHYVIAFVCFRIFDIAKFWPASHFDRQNTGFAVMFDDVIMAVPALALTQLIISLI